MRDCVPAPQDVEQLPHESQGVTTLSTGHAWALQAVVSDMAGHKTPPCAGASICVRMRVAMPEPHDFEHADHAVKAETMQSTGHGAVLHWR